MGTMGILGIRVGVKKIVVVKKPRDCGLRVFHKPLILAYCYW